MFKKLLIVALLSITYVNANDSGLKDINEDQYNSGFSNNANSIEKSSSLNTSIFSFISLNNNNKDITNKIIEENEIFREGTADSVQFEKLAQLSKENNQKTNSWSKICLDYTWKFTKKLVTGTVGTLGLAYVVAPIAVDGLWTLALSEGTASKYARSVLRFFKPSLNYVTTNFVNHLFKLI